MSFMLRLARHLKPDIYKTIAEDNRRKLVKIVIGILILKYNSNPYSLFY
jgi:hypothetical protein